MLILVWDIDETILYQYPCYKSKSDELELVLSVSKSFHSWRAKKQLLVILNTARTYNEFDFSKSGLNLPEADFIITNVGSRYFTNDFITPEFSLQPSTYTEFLPRIKSLSISWPNIFQSPCTGTPSVNTMEIRCPQNGNIFNIYQSVQAQQPINRELAVWAQLSLIPEQKDIIFAYHKHFNKGAGLARLINRISAQDPDVRNKVKWVATAGDSLMDTSMMNTRMDYPFPQLELSEHNPGLPVNTSYIGTVLSKGGHLQENRFKSLFNEKTTVHSKVKSIAGIIEGTVELLLRHISHL